MSQSFNLNAVLYYPWVRFFKKPLAIPHFFVKDIRKIDFQKLKEYGFKGIILDKDNTITAPYKDEIFRGLETAVQSIIELFNRNVVIMSNHAGTLDDKRNDYAQRLEQSIGLPILRHSQKKPGGIQSVKKYFTCKPSKIVMIGDRIFTDVVFGNRYGMLTIHTTVLTEEGDNPAASKARHYELPLIKKWLSLGIEPPTHKLYHKDISHTN